MNNPAEQAAIECMKKVNASLNSGNNFLVEAGAGAGKTYTLIESLNHLIEKNSKEFQRLNKKIACITYTNVAKDEIRSRTDNHPIVYAETIHAFCWDILKAFQKPLLSLLHTLTPQWANRCEETPRLNQKVKYDLGYPKLTEAEAYLHHDDVIKLMAALLDDKKFQVILKNKFPIILIDEYQDTNKDLVESIIRNFIEPKSGPQIGFFGDHWQTIFGSRSVGSIKASPDKLDVIGKNANFRSEKIIVDALNRIRVELPQYEADPLSKGEIKIFDSNSFKGNRRTDNHWQEDLPEQEAHDLFIKSKSILEQNGWDFSPDRTKILMLTNNLLAAEQGYSNLFRAFSDNDDLLKKNDKTVAFLSDIVDPAISFFDDKKFGDMLRCLNLNIPKIKTHQDKKRWYDYFKLLSETAKQKTVGEVLDQISSSSILRLPDRVSESEKKLIELKNKHADERTGEEIEFINRREIFRNVKFEEIVALGKYVDDKTPFSTKHGVKGAQFENVMVVLGRGWNNYNWNQMLEWADNVPANKIDAFERNRNLFYVACSRPKKRLALVFSQKLSTESLSTLKKWFDVDSTSLI